jgi:GNAT superfamily N-acetyltransferase
VTDLRFEELGPHNQHEARGLILAGLAEHWGSVDPTLNPELDDMVQSYGHGRTVVVRGAAGTVVGTATILPRPGNRAEILRMSVATEVRRQGLGRRMVTELLATARQWGADCVVLETTSAWSEVVQFYLSCGFAITHTEAGDFGDDTWFEHHIGEHHP